MLLPLFILSGGSQVFLGLATASSASAAADGSPSYTPGTGSSTLVDIPQLTASKAQFMGNQFSNCSNIGGALATTAAAGSWLGGACAAGGESLDSTCPAAAGLSMPPIDCNLLGLAGGGSGAGSQQLLQSMMKQLQMAECAFNCQQGKIQAINAMTACLQSSSQDLKNEANSLNTALSAQARTQAQQMLVYKQQEADSNAKIVSLTNKLDGNGSTPGLLATVQAAQTLLQEAPNQIHALQAQRNKVNQLAAALQTDLKTAKMGYISTCLNTPNQAYTCGASGPMTFLAAEQCIYELNASGSLQANGQRIYNTSLTNQANAKSAGLGQLFTNILGTLPTSSAVPGVTTPDPNNPSAPPVAANTQSLMNLDPATLEANFDQQLSAYQVGPNRTLSNDFNQAVAYCAALADREFNQQQKQSSAGGTGAVNNSAYGQRAQQVIEEEQSFEQQYNTQINSLAPQVAALTGALTGQAQSINTNACTNAPADNQIACVQTTVNNVQGVLYGSIYGPLSIPIQGNGHGPALQVSCNQGAVACAKTLQNVKTNLTQELPVIAKEKEQYAQAAVQGRQQFVQSIATQLSAQSTLEQSAINKLNKARASLGQGPLQLPAIQGQPVALDPDGLPEPFQSGGAIGEIAEYVNPPILDASQVTSDNSANAAQQIAQNLAQIRAQELQLQALPNTCQANMLNGMMSNLQQQAQSVQMCPKDLCERDYFQKNLDAALAAANHLDSLAASQGQSMYNGGSLSTGVANLCPPTDVRGSGLESYPGPCNAYLQSLIQTARRLGGHGGGSSLGDGRGSAGGAYAH